LQLEWVLGSQQEQANIFRQSEWVCCHAVKLLLGEKVAEVKKERMKKHW
jgi:hypothetical protein